MKNNNTTIVSVLIAIVVVVLIGYLIVSNNKNNLAVNDNNASSTPSITNPASSTPISTTSVVYVDNIFGFTFSLPDNWKGYSIIKSTWEGTPLTTNGTKESGTKLIIRNPKWTSAKPYEDIPVMVFTLAQWNSYLDENFSVSAAPVRASELGRNNLYVFALPPRWNFDNSEGYAEAESIVNSKPLNAFNVQTK